MENARLLDELRQRTDQVKELNRGLEARVAEQVEELGRIARRSTRLFRNERARSNRLPAAGSALGPRFAMRHLMI
jgi:hypothetical protein